jgi:hypothetical protein
MSLVVSGLTAYAKAEGFPLIVQAITRGNTANLVNIVSGLKGTGLVPFLSSSVTLAAGGSCSFTNNGVSTFSEVELAVKPVEFMEAVCVGALEGKAMMYEVAGYDALPYSAQFLQDKADQISKKLDNLYWLGATGSGDVFNGFVAQATAASRLDTITGSTSNVYDAIDLAIDTAVAADSTFESSDTVAIFLNYAKYRTLQKELVVKNYFHYGPSATETGNMEITFPGTKIKVIPTEGLAGHSFLYLADTAHLHIGTNLLSDTEGLNVFHDQITNNIYLRSQFYAGTGVSKTLFKKAC